MTQEKTENKQKKEWQKTTTILTIICAIFNPVSLSIILFVFYVIFSFCAYHIITPICKKNSELIKEQLLPLCNGHHYVYDGYDNKKIMFNYNDSLQYYSKSGKLESCNFDYYELDFLAYTDENYYLLIPEKKTNKNYVCRTTHDLKGFEVLNYLGDLDIERMISGYDSKLYYESNNQYYAFDLSTSELKEVDSESEEAMIVKSTKIKKHHYNGYYESFSGTYFGDCIRENGKCCFDIDGNSCVFDENSIIPEVFEIMKTFSFKPKYHLSSFVTGISAIIYYANADYEGDSECLIVEYNRFDESVAPTYQLFTHAETVYFRLLPMLVL